MAFAVGEDPWILPKGADFGPEWLSSKFTWNHYLNQWAEVTAPYSVISFSCLFYSSDCLMLEPLVKLIFIILYLLNMMELSFLRRVGQHTVEVLPTIIG